MLHIFKKESKNFSFGTEEQSNGSNLFKNILTFEVSCLVHCPISVVCLDLISLKNIVNVVFEFTFIFRFIVWHLPLYSVLMCLIEKFFLKVSLLKYCKQITKLMANDQAGFESRLWFTKLFCQSFLF